MSTISLAEGSIFAERYRVVRCIAAGGMGAVYEAVHLETNRRRALKVMLPRFLQSEELKERFRKEASVVADIESDFIVDVFDAGVDPATQIPFLAMELLRGDELGKLLRERKRFTAAEVVTYLHQAALALDKTHRAMIVHRDLKPENLFLTFREDGVPRIKVLDFGIAKVVAESGTHVNATRSIGTPLYMAPEQFRPGDKVSPSTDLFALAMVAYALLVGRAYWADEAEGSGGNVFAFASAAMNGPQERACERARRAGVLLPQAFDVWFAKAVAFAPADRFSSATVMTGGLAEALGVPRPRLERSGPPSTGESSARPEVNGSPGLTAPGISGTKALERPRARGAGAVVGIGLGATLAVAAIGGASVLVGARSLTTAEVPTSAPAERDTAAPGAQTPTGEEKGSAAPPSSPAPLQPVKVVPVPQAAETHAQFAAPAQTAARAAMAAAQQHAATQPSAASASKSAARSTQAQAGKPRLGIQHARD
ncbi:serine/threonine-protein kinase [Sorangium sp. So ce362]|uniref:serine/threonine-protein kinase n=1 Tax=Sorangium sp. So ce362 TaxID=3133303 RepID=UPI003F63119B